MGAVKLSLPKTHCMEMKTAPMSIPARVSKDCAFRPARGVGDKYETGATSSPTLRKKIFERDYISVATWNVRTPAQATRSHT